MGSFTFRGFHAWFLQSIRFSPDDGSAHWADREASPACVPPATATCVVDQCGLAELEVRPGFERYGSAAFFNASRELLAIWIEADQVVDGKPAGRMYYPVASSAAHAERLPAGEALPAVAAAGSPQQSPPEAVPARGPAADCTAAGCTDAGCTDVGCTAALPDASRPPLDGTCLSAPPHAQGGARGVVMLEPISPISRHAVTAESGNGLQGADTQPAEGAASAGGASLAKSKPPICAAAPGEAAAARTAADDDGFEARRAEAEWAFAQWHHKCTLLYSAFTVTHLATCHIIVANTIVIATREALSPGHVLRRLLWPFTLGTITINHAALVKLFGEVSYDAVTTPSRRRHDAVTTPTRALQSVTERYRALQILSLS